MTRRLTALLIAVIAVGLLTAAPALAALSNEASAGQTVAARLQSGQASCHTLSNSDFEHLGEYVMDRMVGSRATHEAMNARMDAMMGSKNADRMHQALGRRYAGCPTTTSGGSGMMGGGGMMGGYYNHGGLGAMITSSNWSWMMGGAWQHMTRQDWQRLQHQLLGTNINTTSHHGWSMAAMMAAVLGGLVLVSLAIVTAIRRPFRRPPAASPSL
jgi:hypothetical protein